MAKLFMPDGEEIQILIELAKDNPRGALAFLSFIQSEILYMMAEESAEN